MARLFVNVDHVASLRQARRATHPDPVLAANIIELAGADGISAHLRSDRRHIRERDLELLKQLVQTRLNLEVSPTQEMETISRQIKPHQVTVVPERPDEITTAGGMDVARNRDALTRFVSNLKGADIQVGIFVEADVEQVKAAHRLDVDFIELSTARYCDARTQIDRFHAFNNLVNAAKAASKLGLVVAAGQGLSYANVKDLIGIKEIEEFHVGFAVVSRGLLVGLERATREMTELVR